MGSAKQISQLDAAVLGAGPAGLALAIALAERGVATALLAPCFDAPWKPSYGGFASTFGSSRFGQFELSQAIRSEHRRPLVLMDGRHPSALGVDYLRLDTHRLQFGLLDAAKALGVRLMQGEANQVLRIQGKLPETLVVGDGVEIAARHVFDATGFASRLTQRSRSAPLGYQSAFGGWFEVESLPMHPDEMWLMDYRDFEGSSQPSFLYAIPEGPHLVFAQQTVLASTQPVDMDELERRLRQRLARLGWRIERQIGEERCVIPLGVGLPATGPAAIAFGAAAGFVNPVSGYQLGRALRVAVRVAECVARGGAREGIEAAIWPGSERISFQLYHAALDQLLRISNQGYGDFIRCFFELPRDYWLRFMAGEQSPSEVVSTMWRLFGRAPRTLRKELMRAFAHCSTEPLFARVERSQWMGSVENRRWI